MTNMNRRSAATYDSDDSASDWDTTVADSPTHNEPLKLPMPANTTNVEPDATYATVVAKPRNSLKGSGDDFPLTNNKSPASTPRNNGTAQSKAQSIASMASPPPHLTSFKNALAKDGTDDSPEVAPSLPPRRYEVGKSQLYTVPESDLLPQTDIVNWDDSDAEEQVLKELQKNIGKEKQRQQQLQQQQQEKSEVDPTKSRERKVTLAVLADNQSSTSPTGSRSDRWKQTTDPPYNSSAKKTETSQRLSSPYDKSAHPAVSEGDVQAIVKQTNRYNMKSGQYNLAKPSSSPMFVKDSSGKRFVFYFEEGSPHFVEVEEDDVDSFLPQKVEEIERLFRRVWREVFAVVRVFTSFFVLFLTELLRFLLQSVVRTLILDSLAAIGDHLLKPLFTVLFNAIIQPALALVWNLCNAAFQSIDPLLRMSGVILSQVAMVLGAFRLFVVNHNPPASYSNDVNVV